MTVAEVVEHGRAVTIIPKLVISHAARMKADVEMTVTTLGEVLQGDMTMKTVTPMRKDASLKRKPVKIFQSGRHHLIKQVPLISLIHARVSFMREQVTFFMTRKQSCIMEINSRHTSNTPRVKNHPTN